MGAGFTLGASGPAFFVLMLEAAAQGAILKGVPRMDALRLATRAMLRTAKLVLSGDKPAAISKKIAGPRGSAMAGLDLLDEKEIQSIISEFVAQSIRATNKLGSQGGTEK